MATVTLRPAANSGAQQMTPVGAAANWDCGNEVAHDDYASYVKHVILAGGFGKATDRYTSTYTDPGDIGAISDVTLFMWDGIQIAADSNLLYVGCRNAGVDYFSGGFIDPAFSPNSYSMATRPWGGSWVKADLDAFVFCLKSFIDATGADGENYFTQVYAVATYLPDTPLPGGLGGIAVAGNQATLDMGDPTLPASLGTIRVTGMLSGLIVEEMPEHEFYVYDRRQKYRQGPIGGGA